MLLENKNAIIYGGAGAIGSAVARAFAREGAHVHLAGRTLASLQVVADEIAAAGGLVEIAEVDALDEHSVDDHAAAVAGSGGIDIAINLVGIPHVQGPPLAELTVEDYLYPVEANIRTNFITSRAVAHYMVPQGSGAILFLTSPGARHTGKGFLGNGVAATAVEGFSRILAGELGGYGIRVNCLRSHALPNTVATSYVGEVFNAQAARVGLARDEWLGMLASGTLLGRLATAEQVAEVATFVASDRAGAMTGAILNLTGGAPVD